MTVSSSAAPGVLRCLIPIQAGGGPPIYCFHGFSGSPAPYGNLVSRLGRDRAVYGVQAVGLTAGVEPDDAWAILVHQILDLDLPVEPLPTLERNEALARVWAAAAARRKLPARFGLDHLGRIFEVCLANEQAAAGHRPQPYRGRVFSLRSSDPAAVPGPDTWTGIVADLVVRRVPGDHHSLMSPAGYPELARQIRLILAEPAGGTA